MYKIIKNVFLKIARISGLELKSSESDILIDEKKSDETSKRHPFTYYGTGGLNFKDSSYDIADREYGYTEDDYRRMNH